LSELHCHALFMFLYQLFMFPFSSGAVGISFLQFTNMNSMRNLIIIGLSLFLGISVPQFFNEYWTSSHHGPVHTNAGWVCFP
jgi:xanthine/uracil permease